MINIELDRSVTIACTGGIGSGKSYIINLLESFGIPAYIADERTKELYKSDRALLQKLVELLGEEIVVKGELQRAVMASKIFSDRSLLERVNAIVHPAVLANFINWREKKIGEGAKILLLESAIYYQVPIFQSVVDKVIAVVAPLELRIERVIKRDRVKREEVERRIASQQFSEEQLHRADFTIFADGKRALLPQLFNIFESIEREQRV